MMKSKEIGSEFWTSEEGTISSNTRKTYLSGRTALTAIILDLKQHGVESVCLPEYCCESMIEPFLRQGMKVTFYPVRKTKTGFELSLERSIDGDAVLLVDYFGFMAEELRELIQHLKSIGKITILDLTHAVFTDERYFGAEYAFGSYRKWTGVELGFASGKDTHRLPSWGINEAGREYLSLRTRARSVKSEFVAHGYRNESLRREQLKLFDQAEEILDREYLSDTDDESKIRMQSLDVAYIKESRRENAKTIYGYFTQLKLCRPLFSELPEDSIPLAVPVLVADEKRDSLRAFLREKGVFCPIHWPVSSLHRVGKDSLMLFENELSFVCDQRYETSDMMRMMEMVKQWEMNTFA